jgi:bifunctional non-homologous end joining protein LigD
VKSRRKSRQTRRPRTSFAEPTFDRREIEKELFHGHAEDLSILIDRKNLRLTHLNKIYFPEVGYTKRQILAYYCRIAKYILPFLRDRPLVLRRYPDGITGKSFFQKDAGKRVPDWIETATIQSEEEKSKEIRYYLANDCAALLYLTNLGCIDHNPWPSRRDKPDHPDYVFFDLDPSTGTNFKVVVKVARAIAAKLQGLGLTIFLKTSGATGFHIYVPIERRYTFRQVRVFAEIISRLVAAELPKETTQERTIAKRRRGTVMIDAYQNSPGRSLVAPYSVRAFPHAPVSAPITAEELRDSLDPSRFNLKTMFGRIRGYGDLWADFWATHQSLENALRKLEYSKG